jgi:hypothetical protein
MISEQKFEKVVAERTELLYAAKELMRARSTGTGEIVGYHPKTGDALCREGMAAYWMQVAIDSVEKNNEY